MARVTSRDLDQVIKIINSNIPDEWDKIHTYSSYGHTGIETHNESKHLLIGATTSEVMNWLRGFQEGMSIGRKLGKSEVLVEMVKETEALTQEQEDHAVDHGISYRDN